MLLYKYLECIYAISSVCEDRIKVSTLNSANDLYEMLPCIIDYDGQYLPSELCRRIFLERLSGKRGFICLSATATDPVLWAHYAAQHTGVALEFDIPTNGALIEVDYRNERVEIRLSDIVENGPALQTAFKALLGRKYTSWSYEKEFRVHMPISELSLEDGLHFKAIPKDQFRRVILGYKCSINESGMRCLLDSSGFSKVGIARTALSDRDFQMDVQQSVPGYPPQSVGSPEP
jgi:hypothetical protein